MGLKVGSIKNFFKPYAAPQDTHSNHDQTKLFARPASEQTEQAESKEVKQDALQSMALPISPPKRRGSAAKNVAQSVDNACSATGSTMSTFVDDDLSDGDTLHIVVPASKSAVVVEAKTTPTGAADLDDQSVKPHSGKIFKDAVLSKTAQNTVQRSPASASDAREQSESRPDMAKSMEGSGFDQAEQTNEKQTPVKANSLLKWEITAGRDESTSPLSTVPSHLSTPLAVRSISKTKQTPALFVQSPLKASVFTTDAIPATSQKSLNSSFSSRNSHRTVVDGVNAVTNSDTEDDNLCSSSDDGLLDLSEMLPIKKRKITPEKSQPTLHTHNVINSTNDSVDHGRPRQRPTKIYQPVTKVYKNSLADMAKQINKESAIAERRKLAEAHVESIHSATEVAADLDTVATGLAGDQEDRERIKAAMLRMEVMSSTDMFYFFSGENDQQTPEWPVVDSSSRWSFLNTDGSRSQAFLSGFVTEMLEFEPLPPEVLVFICQALLHEHDEFLCRHYLQVLEQSVQKGLMTSLQDSCSLQTLYAGCTIFDKKSGSQQSLPHSLKHALSLLAILSKSTPSTTQLAKVILELILLNVDQHVSGSIDLRLCIGRALDVIFTSGHIQQAVPTIINNFLNLETLSKIQCCQAINSLPAMTAAVHRFRRQLAIHYVLEVDADELVELNSLDSGTRLLVKLKHDSRFNGDDDTDWNFFQEMMKVLDIAFDAGFSSFHFLGGSSSLSKNIGKRSQSETDFNAQIDAFTRQLRLVSNKIKDAGTSHLRRTEAKHALNAVVMRLESCVRTRPARKAGIFGGLESHTLQSFLSSAVDTEAE